MDSSEQTIGPIHVTSMIEAVGSQARHGAVITIEDPDCSFGFRVSNGMPQLVLAFHDVTSVRGQWIAPGLDHVKQAIEFARKHRGSSLLIHCHAGISRSPAIALAIIADRLGPGRETEAVSYLHAKLSNIEPNLRIVACAEMACFTIPEKSWPRRQCEGLNLPLD